MEAYLIYARFQMLFTQSTSDVFTSNPVRTPMSDNEQHMNDGLEPFEHLDFEFGAYKEVFDAIVGDHRTLHRECMQIVGSPLDAEDVLQVAMRKALKNIQQFDGNASISAWFAEIARAKCQDFLQRKNAQTQTTEHNATVLKSFATQFNGCNWSAVRALFSSRVQLDVADSYSGAFRDDYFDTYYKTRGCWHFALGTIGDENIVVRWEAAERWETHSFIRVETTGDRITRIADYSRLWWLLYDAGNFTTDLPP